MDFREREVNFQEADRRYIELTRQREAGLISDKEFDAQHQQLIVEDDEGRLWIKSRDTGEWRYRDGRGWTRGTPPDYKPLRTPSAESAPHSQFPLEQGDRSSSSRTTLPSSATTKDQSRVKQHRDLFYGVVLIAGILVAVGMLLWRFLPSVPDEERPLPEEPSGPAPGYALLEHGSGALSVEVPVEWDERIYVDSEGEKGRSSWSSFLAEDKSAGPSMTAVNDLDSWRTGTPGHQGVYMVASRNLAQEYTDNELVTLGPNDYSSSCETSITRDLDRPPYSGKILEWENCAGDSDHTAITLAAAPQVRECVIVAQIGGYFLTEADEESIQHVLDTLETDCGKID